MKSTDAVFFSGLFVLGALAVFSMGSETEAQVRPGPQGTKLHQCISKSNDDAVAMDGYRFSTVLSREVDLHRFYRDMYDIGIEVLDRGEICKPPPSGKPAFKVVALSLKAPPNTFTAQAGWAVIDGVMHQQ